MRRIGVFSLCLILMLSALVGAGTAKTKIRLMTHWADYQINGIYVGEGDNRKLTVKGLKQITEDYMKLHPDVEIEIQPVPMNDYMQRVMVGRTSGDSPDIYTVYSLHAVQLAREGILDVPPADLIKDIKKNYTSSSVAGTTIDGKIYGIPFEIGNYCLVYNKKMLAAAGYSAPPATWNELVAMAPKLTKKDEKGNITVHGFAFMTGWDSAVVHPFLGLLWDLGGDLFTKDLKKCIVNSKAGVAALEAELRLFKNGGTSTSGSVWNFPQKKTAMMIMAPWYENSIKQAMPGGEFEETVGVAPIPRIKKRVNAMYTWFIGVDSQSRVKKAVWDFLRWFSMPAKGSKTTILGNYIVDNIGSIPARQLDLDNHPEALNDHFTKTFIAELKYSRAEPNVAQGQEIKTILMNEIVEAWNGRKTAQEALDSAARQINDILKEIY